MFNFQKFLSNMKKAGWKQIAVSNSFPRNVRNGEIAVFPKSMPNWGFYFSKAG